MDSYVWVHAWLTSIVLQKDKVQMENVALKLKLTNMKKQLENPLASSAGSQVGACWLRAIFPSQHSQP